jgi:hypothetical protein
MNYSNPGQLMADEPSYRYSSDDRQMKTPAKRPGFLARWFLKKLMEGAEWEKRLNQEKESAISVNRLSTSMAIQKGPASIDQPERALHFTVYVANGGRVVETRRYDKKTDRNTNGLYVINNDADFGKEIDKIITMEALRQ